MRTTSHSPSRLRALTRANYLSHLIGRSLRTSPTLTVLHTENGHQDKQRLAVTDNMQSTSALECRWSLLPTNTYNASSRALQKKTLIVVRLELLGREQLPISSLSVPEFDSIGQYIFPLTHALRHTKAMMFVVL
jgi:hypothetical protein